MNNIKYQSIIILLTLLFLYSCQKSKVDEINPINIGAENEAIIEAVPVDCSEPLKIVQLERSRFDGQILGQNVVFKEFLSEDRENIEIQQLPNFAEIYSWKNFFMQIGSFDRIAWRTSKLKIDAGLEGSKGRRIYITTPSLPITNENGKWSYNNPQTLKDLFCRGQKELERAQIMPDSLKGFVITYSQYNPNSIESSYYSSAFGKQQNNALQIVDVKQFTPLPPSKAPYGLQVKYRINCKLYKATGEYVGDIKDAELVTKYYYEPIPQ